MELIDLGRALQGQLYGSRRDLEQHPLFQSHPGLVNRLVSKLTYCVREAPVRYISVEMSGVSGRESFSVAVYTDDHFFHLTYDSNLDHISTAVRDRKTAKTVEVLSAPNFMEGDAPGTYQGALKVAVTYDGLKVWLPGDNEATETNREQLDNFFPSLLDDLLER